MYISDPDIKKWWLCFSANDHIIISSISEIFARFKGKLFLFFLKSRIDCRYGIKHDVHNAAAQVYLRYSRARAKREIMLT